MNLPLEFISNIQNTFQKDGQTFLNRLPEQIAEASARWGLTEVQPSATLSYNFVAFAKRGEQEVVLKMGVPNRELKSEMAALRLFNGEGACKLIDYDEEKYWMLLERLRPGVMLSTLEDDEEATNIAADVMLKIWRPIELVTLPKEHRDNVSKATLAPHAHLPSHSLRFGDASQWRAVPGSAGESLCDTGERPFGRDKRSFRVTYNNFIQLSDWFNGLKRLRAMFNGGTGPLNEKLVDRVEGLVKDFFAENHKPVLMHGDFHHFNILSSERGWLVIDPKGVIGPACYEVGPLLMNPWDDLLSRKDYRPMTKRRIDILHERLGFERERILEWGLSHAILSAWWSIEDHGDWRYAADFAEMIAEIN